MKITIAILLLLVLSGCVNGKRHMYDGAGRINPYEKVMEA